MAAEEKLIRSEEDGSLSFGNYELAEKKKLENFSHEGDLYKVKTFFELTKLERNGMFAYESVPGTNVERFRETNDGLTFFVSGSKDAEITVGLEEETTYEIYTDGKSAGVMKTNMSGKLTVSVELSEGHPVSVKIIKK